MSDYKWNIDVKLESVFDECITVPDYQRDYSWGSLEATDYFKDLVKFTKSCENDYLFGQFIFLRDENNKLFVIDGQQRLVTTTIFVSVARNIVKELKDINRDDDDFIQFWNWIIQVIGKESKEEYKLTLGGKANNYFLKSIQRTGGPENSGKYKAMKNISAVYRVFYEQISQYISDCSTDSERFDRIFELMESLMQHFMLSIITTTSLRQAYTIFETLNSRGKDLEASDLLKNYFFHLCGTSIKEDWNEASSIISDAGESISPFIRAYWNSKYKLVRQRQVYRTISDKIKDKRTAKSFVEGLNRLSKYYLSMVSPTNNPDAFENENIKNVLISLKLLGTKLYYPMILACVEVSTDDKTILKMLNAVENLTIRNIIIGPDTANKFEEKFSDFANKITSKQSTVDDIIAEIVKITSPDETFRHTFEMATIKDTSVSRYVLASIYNYENGPENIINPNSSTVNVEHILPRNCTKWTSVSESDRDTYLYYIGNQTLLKSEDNTSISNDPYLSKKATYAKSKIPQNGYFTDIDNWGPEEIQNRQKTLMEVAIKRWPGPSTS